jgi:hypothetical protein
VQAIARCALELVVLHHYPLAVFHIEVVQKALDAVAPQHHLVAAVGLEARGGLSTLEGAVLHHRPAGLFHPDTSRYPPCPQAPHHAALAFVQHHGGVGFVEIVAEAYVAYLEALHHNAGRREG